MSVFLFLYISYCEEIQWKDQNQQFIYLTNKSYKPKPDTIYGAVQISLKLLSYYVELYISSQLGTLSQ